MHTCVFFTHLHYTHTYLYTHAHLYTHKYTSNSHLIDHDLFGSLTYVYIDILYLLKCCKHTFTLPSRSVFVKELGPPITRLDINMMDTIARGSN